MCEKVIATPCEACGNAWKNAEDYTTVQVPWSNGSRMDVAVCAGCAQGPVWAADKALMTQAIQDAWDKAGGRYNKADHIV